MSDEMEARIVARVRRQFGSEAIDFAGWELTGPSNVRVATYRVGDSIVASRMRDRGFRVVDRNGRVSAVVGVEPLATPAPDRGIEMFGRFCRLVLALLAVAVTAWLVFGKGGVR